MFYPFTIQSSVISQLQLETGTYYSATEDPDKWTRKAQLRQYLSSTNGLVDGKALKEVLFPKGKYNIFLSHSHGDIQVAQYLKAWFKQYFSVGSESVILNEAAMRDSLQMTHPLDVSGFKSIDKADLAMLKYYKKEEALNILYKRKMLLRR